MTLCISATCVDEKRNRCIVISSDFKAEVGEFAGAEIQNKLYWLYNNSWPVLVSVPRQMPTTSLLLSVPIQ